MNRNNIWVHIGLATVVVAAAAVIGQIERWRSMLKTNHTETKRVEKKVAEINPTADVGNPEVLVRFKPGTTLDRIRAIASANHDSLTDEIESVSGLTEIDDLD